MNSFSVCLSGKLSPPILNTGGMFSVPFFQRCLWLVKLLLRNQLLALCNSLFSPSRPSRLCLSLIFAIVITLCLAGGLSGFLLFGTVLPGRVSFSRLGKFHHYFVSSWIPAMRTFAHLKLPRRALRLSSVTKKRFFSLFAVLLG